MTSLIHPTYFPNITTFGAIVQNEICWEVHDNYQKQTYRNRVKICTDRGLHMLSIPIVHVGNAQGRQLYKDVRIDNSYSWQRQHWRTFETAYRTSPFFEFYEDDIRPLYNSKSEYLLDFNIKTIEIICDFLQVEISTEKTAKFESTPQNTNDYRSLVSSKKKLVVEQVPYHQVFGDRHGFISDLSILDVLFNLGPETIGYLKQVTLNLEND